MKTNSYIKLHIFGRNSSITAVKDLICLAAAVLMAATICIITSFGAADDAEIKAEELTNDCTINYGEESTVITSGKDVAGIYIEWKKTPEPWILTAKRDEGEQSVGCGQYGFLHEYKNVSGGEITLNVSNLKEKINKLQVFGSGALPEEVQVWEPACEKADLMLLSTHADDEHLFFAGILPYYAGEMNMAVQVVYMVNHNDSVSRPHELLNGLWAVGVRNYPVIGEAPDLYSESLGGAYEIFADNGYDKEYFVKFLVENIRRFQPLVIVGHDIDGEYGHGAHMLYTDALREALTLCGSDYDNASAEKYGLWTVPKAYLHLYKENQIVIDWDGRLLSKFGGRSAFRVSIEEGFAEHESQHYTWFSKWCGYSGEWGVTSSADIESLPGKSGVYSIVKNQGFSPRLFGLYSSEVGEDVVKNDFFENIDAESLRMPGITPTSEPAYTPEQSASASQTPENDDKNGTAELPTGTIFDNNDDEPGKYVGDKTDNIVLFCGIIIFIAALILITAVFLRKIRSS